MGPRNSIHMQGSGLLGVQTQQGSYERQEKTSLSQPSPFMYIGNITLLVDHFLDLFHETSSHQKQAVLILNEIMLGSIASPMDDSNKASWEGSACPALREISAIESAVR